MTILPKLPQLCGGADRIKAVHELNPNPLRRQGKRTAKSGSTQGERRTIEPVGVVGLALLRQPEAQFLPTSRLP
jgi:hypothetical protein